MWTINAILTAVLDAVYSVLTAIHPAAPLLVISAVFGVLALVVIKYCSSQSAIESVKDRIKANLLAIKLYKDELPVMFASFFRVLAGAFKLQLLMIPPVLVMLIPMVMVCSQMAARQEWRPLAVGERGVLTITVKDELPDSVLDIQPDSGTGLVLKDRVRSLDSHQVSWNVEAIEPGRHVVDFLVGGKKIAKEIVVGNPLDRVSPLRHSGSLLDSLLYPCEEPLSKESVVQSISIQLGSIDSVLYGSTWWIVWFLVISIAVALMVKPFMNVKI